MMRENVAKIFEVTAGYENLSYSQWIERAAIEKLQRDYGLTIEAILRGAEADKQLVEAAHTLISAPILEEKYAAEK